MQWHVLGAAMFVSPAVSVISSALLLQAENIYNDEDPDTPARDLEAAAAPQSWTCHMTVTCIPLPTLKKKETAIQYFTVDIPAYLLHFCINSVHMYILIV